MGVREGGSYVVEGAGAERLVERTEPLDPVKALDAGPAPDVLSAPAADADAEPRRRGASAPKPQE